MSNMKCPFCQQELEYNKDYAEYQCWNPNCEQTNACVGSKNLWQALITTRKALDIAVEALERIKEPITWGSLYLEQEIADEALKQINQKE